MDGFLHARFVRRGAPMPARVCAGVELAAAGLAGIGARRDARGRVMFDGITPAALRMLPAAACLPVADSLTVWLDAPFADWSKNRRVLPALLDAQLPFPLEDCCYDFVAARRAPTGGTQVLALAARRVNVEACLARYRAAGVDPLVLDHTGLALWTWSVTSLPLPAECARVIVHIQASVLTVVIGRGAEFHHAHALALPRAPAAHADADAVAEDLMRRLERVLHAELAADRPLHWVFVPGADAPPELAEALARRLTACRAAPLAHPADAASFLPRALAARALTAGPWRCNLRDAVLLHPAVHRWRRRARRRAAAFFLAAGILLLAGNFLWQTSFARRLDRMRSVVAGLAATLAPESRIPYGREVEEATRAWEAERNASAGLRAVLAADLHARVGELTAAGAAAAAAFQSLRADDEKFEIQAAAADWGRGEDLARRLRGMAGDVQLEALPALEDGRAAFIVKGAWR